MSDMTLADRLIWARQQAGLSISQASELSEMSEHIIVALEAGWKVIVITALDAMAETYNVDTRWLIAGVERSVIMPDTSQMTDEERESLRQTLARTRQVSS